MLSGRALGYSEDWILGRKRLLTASMISGILNRKTPCIVEVFEI